MSDNLQQLDQGGTNCQFVKTWLGPSLGWAMLPVMPELVITSASALTISAFSSRVLLNAAVKAIALPAVSQWMLATLPLANISGFDRSLWIKDYIGDASSGSPIVVTPNGSDTIDGLASYSIITPNDLLRLYPITTLAGWYTG
jgi:hypothetical protein